MTKKFLLLILFAFAFSGYLNAQESGYKLLIFEGSDWCSNCIRFNETIMSDESVASFLDEQNITSEHIDFPQRKKLDDETKTYNAFVAEQYDFKGLFPTILLVDNTSEQVVELRYQNQDPKTFINLIKSYLKSER